MSRRWYLKRLRLPFYYWVEEQPAYRIIIFKRANECKDLPELLLKVKRMGREKKVKLEPVTSAKLLRGDGQEITSLETHEGGRIIVQSAAGQRKALNFNFDNPPPRPEPYERPASAQEGAGETPKSDEDFNWDFGKTVE